MRTFTLALVAVGASASKIMLQEGQDAYYDDLRDAAYTILDTVDFMSGEGEYEYENGEGEYEGEYEYDYSYDYSYDCWEGEGEGEYEYDLDYAEDADGTLYPHPDFNDLGPWDSDGDGDYTDEDWYRKLYQSSFGSWADGDYYTTWEKLEEDLMNFNWGMDNESGMQIVAWPGVDESEWHYSWTVGEDVLYESDWTWDPGFVEKRMLFERLSEYEGETFNGDDYPFPDRDNLGPWDMDGDGSWTDDSWWEQVIWYAFYDYDWEKR